MGVHKTTRRQALRLGATGLFSALIAGRAAAQNVKCPICNNGTYFTGQTRNDVTGKLLQKYQCMLFSQHVFWVPM